MSKILAITRKELSAYFGSPMAAIFLGAFLVGTMFSFFWVETFFARNIADVRPLFLWMPTLLIFLVAALTMRQWSEEQKMGTLEVLLTLPVKISHLVLGKYLAVLGLVAVALLLTMGLPVTASLLGNLDWGPVFGGYLGAVLLASAYVSIGLFVSSRTDNQIIALILTVLLCGIFYMVGSSEITAFAGNKTGEILRGIGTGSRFESIERGVIDLRDLVYYASITVFFLVMNVLFLDKKRWSTGETTAPYRRSAVLALVFAGLNLLAVNVWIFPVHGLRLDLTENSQYSISPTTKDLVSNLTEPLLIRGYFSEKTHPLLAPLVPGIRDLIKEYGIASGGMITVEFVDPRENEELEAEANQNYGIKPVPFRVSGRYEASVVNSYFNILIKYGDQHVTLGFQDLIEIKPRPNNPPEVKLRNLEYDLTRSIKKVVYGFQSVDSIFANIDKKIRLIAFITPNTLPEELSDLPSFIEKVARQIGEESGGKFKFEQIDPDAQGSRMDRRTIEQRYGLQPMAFSLFSNKTFYLHLLLQIGENMQRIYPAAGMSEADLRTEIEAALKRGASGFLKTVGLWTPPPPAPDPRLGAQPQASNYNFLKTQLSQNYNVKDLDLTSGRVPGDVDVLLLLAPQGMTDRQRYAVDQYLMRGGAVVMAAGRFVLAPQSFRGGGLAVNVVKDGINNLLLNYGVEVQKALVLDDRNEPFPVPVIRRIGSFQVREIQQVNYPFFVDVRSSGMPAEHPIVSSLPAVTMNWVSPIKIDYEKISQREVSVLLRSSSNSWIQEDNINIQPNLSDSSKLGFNVTGETGARTLAVALTGSFDSYFKGKGVPENPENKNSQDSQETKKHQEHSDPMLSTIDRSPKSSRLVVAGSSEFINDTVLAMSRNNGQDRFLNSLQFLQNTVDWAVEDEDLLRIRSRGSQAHLLEPVSKERQAILEAVNYGAAITALILVSVIGMLRRRREKPMRLIKPREV